MEGGASDRSYGIHVARLAGVPKKVVDRAKEILGNLENDAYGRDGLPRLSRTVTGIPGPTRTQPSLFPMMQPPQAPAQPEPQDPVVTEVLALLRAQDPNGMTPMQALQLLDEICERLKKP